MIFERIKTPGIAHVAYLIGNWGEAAVVDPRRDVDDDVKLARKHKVTINRWLWGSAPRAQALQHDPPRVEARDGH